MQSSSRSASTSSRRSNQSLSDKLSKRIPYGGDEQQRRSTRKRLSLASETSSSTTGGSSSATPASADPLAAAAAAGGSSHALSNSPVVSSPRHHHHHHRHQQHHQHHHHHQHAQRKNQPTNMNNSASIGRRRKSSVTRKDDKKKNAKGHSSLSTLLLEDEWEQTLRDAAAGMSASDTRLRASRGSRRSAAKASKSKATTSSNGDSAMSSPSRNRRSSTANITRGRSSRKLQHQHHHQQHMGSQSDQLHSIRRRSSSSPVKERRQKVMRRSSHKKTTKPYNTEQQPSLSSFMQKEKLQLPLANREEALEVRSAYTSISRARNARKAALLTATTGSSSLNSRDDHHHKHHHHQRRSKKEMSVSYQGCSARRSNSLRDLTSGGGGGGSGGASRSRSSSRTRMKDAKYSLGSGGGSTRSFATLTTAGTSLSGSQQDEPPVRRTPHDNPQTTNVDTGRHFHQYHPNNFTSLPVLREERKVKSAKKKTLKKSPISQQELSDFLNKCNAKRKHHDNINHGLFPSSPLSGDRSCASLPAVSSSPRNKLRKSSTHSSRTPPNTKILSNNRRQQSQRSFQTSNSDPYPTTEKAGPLIGKLANKKGRRSRSRSKNGGRTPRKDRSESNGGKQSKATTELSSSRRDIEDSKRRSTSFVKERQPRDGSDERTRSLSRTRHITQQATTVATLECKRHQESPGRHGNSTNKKLRGRPKGFQKLFSIRDFTSQDAESSDSSQSMENTDATLTFSVLRSPTNPNLRNRRTGDAMLLMTPPPPLAPYSPASKDRARNISQERGHSKSPKGGQGFTTSKSEHQERPGDTRRSRRHSSHADAPDARHGKRSPVQASGGDTAEDRESSRRNDVGRQAQQRETAQYEEERDSGIEEDIFSHYTWSSSISTTRQDQYQEEMQRERMQLKDSIRQSLLYKAFESIDRVLQ